jgi:hypothetical protein
MPKRWVAVLLFLWVPSSLAAADFPGGTVQATGTVYLDGAVLRNSSAVSTGDVVETRDSGIANLNLVGSAVQIQPSTYIKFERAGIDLDHGTVLVSSGKQLSVLTRCLRVTPTTTDWTQFDVTRSNGRVHVVARKGDVVIHGEGAPRIVVKESKETWREDGPGCGGGILRGATPAAKAPIMGAATAERAALAAGAGLLTWVFLQSDDPVSPAIP